MITAAQIRAAIATASEACDDPERMSAATHEYARTILLAGTIEDVGGQLVDKLEQIRWLLDRLVGRMEQR